MKPTSRSARKPSPAKKPTSSSREKATFFPSPAAFRRWLAAHHDRQSELWVGFHKRATGAPSLTWQQSVDEALCYGWIDGVRQRIDEARYRIRFTPRRASSIWSAVNIRRMGELVAEGRVSSAGLASFERRRDDRSAIYAYEQRREARFSPEEEKRFRGHRKAWAFFERQPPGYRRLVTFRAVSAKREATRRKRLDELIAASSRGERLDGMAPKKRRGA